MFTRTSRTFLIAMSFAALLFCTGCPRPPRSAVLFGRWSLSTQPPNAQLGDFFLDFDQNGNLIRITYTVAGADVSTTDFSANSTISGTDVSVDGSFGVSTFSFDGTLAADLRSATGNVTMSINVPGLQITINGAQATLTKQ